MAIGLHLGSRATACVYLQNSGLGNLVNPLVSLAHTQVYQVPIFFVIGWRGEPGTQDEPQHKAQGALTQKLLETLGVEFTLLPSQREEMEEAMAAVARRMQEGHAIHQALLVRAGTFKKYSLTGEVEAGRLLSMSREAAIEALLDHLAATDAVVSTTGMASREVFEVRQRAGQGHQQDFLTVGGMGHCSSIALALAFAQPSRRVICLDGDGAALMHLGALHTIAQAKPANLNHVLLNNGAHDSVGGQPTLALDANLTGVAQALGYRHVSSVSTMEELVGAWPQMMQTDGPNFLEVCIKKGSRSDLGRPTSTPVVNKKAYMEFLDN
mmetsp:Transcript_39653/g.55062  ORF Transcript_39653/g.55062 Transcript_39653/m.55062 type:complete len:325 (+) Transcript_39653:35-1009(+)|eukprot:CAMPEP_0196580264 /NCGR_PEP_ID=MMETSP1081-20130531/28119_1 /TAXON_ID=36882 /ORGANISM="Pyramimonas amylifera, Strain CCMP720" /LENGTH=324 /DNA_ID=CAMNT_0041900095 /DNA_START=35 /DNA_END=1009 /DNA_ORIENTATION=-